MNSEFNEAPKHSNAENAQIGTRLRLAREERNLSIKDVADSLRLRVSVIEDIENNQFNNEKITTFIRGYIRAYAKLVNIDADSLLQEQSLFPVVQQQDVKMQSFSKKTRRQKSDSRIMTLTWAIFSVAIGITIIWWWQAKQRDLIEQPQEIAQQNATEKTINTSTMKVSRSELVATAVETKSTEKPVVTPAKNTVETTTKKNSSVVKETVKEETVKEVTKPKVEVKAPNIEMNFIADCWVDIRDANGKRLLTGIKSRGEKVELNGKQPFKLVLGAPSAVELKYNGKKVDLSNYPPKRVARLSLPKK